MLLLLERSRTCTLSSLKCVCLCIIQSFDALLKEKDVELQQLLNSLKNAQRSKQDSEENLQRALREKDGIIQQLQHTLELKTKDMQVTHTHTQDILTPTRVNSAQKCSLTDLRPV